MSAPIFNVRFDTIDFVDDQKQINMNRSIFEESTKLQYFFKCLFD